MDGREGGGWGLCGPPVSCTWSNPDDRRTVWNVGGPDYGGDTNWCRTTVTTEEVVETSTRLKVCRD